jgi:fumarate hydratase subunit beta
VPKALSKVAGDAAYHQHAPLTLEQLHPLQAGDIGALSGVLYVTRDAAHARMAVALAAGQLLPFDPDGHALYYMGPTPAPPGMPIGSDRAARRPPRTLTGMRRC